MAASKRIRALNHRITDGPAVLTDESTDTDSSSSMLPGTSSLLFFFFSDACVSHLPIVLHANHLHLISHVKSRMITLPFLSSSAGVHCMVHRLLHLHTAVPSFQACHTDASQTPPHPPLISLLLFLDSKW